MARLIASSEWRWILLWTAVALLATNVPYLLGWTLSTFEMEFGGAAYNIEDVNSYIAKMRLGARGEWLFRIPYTTEEHPGTIIYIHYLLLGKLATLASLSLEATFHLARLACGGLLLITIYCFLARYTPHLAVRRVAFLLVAFSGGMGWVLTLLGKADWLGDFPIDLILPEGYAFLTLYSPPHIALATASLFWGLVHLEDALACQRIGSVVASAVAFLITALIGAFYLLVPYAILGITWTIAFLRRRRPDWRALGWICVSGFPSALVIGYDYYYFVYDPIYGAWATQNQVRSPHPLHYVAGYLIVGALALLGAYHALRKRRWRLMVPLTWVAIVPLLLYLPLNLQRRLIVGAQVPLCLLAALGLTHSLALPFGRSRIVLWLSRYARYSRAGMRRWLVSAVILLTIPTNLLLILGNCVEVARQRPPIYHSRGELDALDWLGTHTAPDDVVLCAYETGNYVPARAGNRVFLGLGTETVDTERKRAEVRRFFDVGETDTWRSELLRQHRIAYLLVGPYERSLGQFEPARAPYLIEVYASGSYALYRVEIEL